MDLSFAKFQFCHLAYGDMSEGYKVHGSEGREGSRMLNVRVRWNYRSLHFRVDLIDRTDAESLESTIPKEVRGLDINFGTRMPIPCIS